MTVPLTRITWSGIHTLDFGTPPDDPRSSLHLEQVVARVPGTGEQDSWTDGLFHRATVQLRYIPASGTADQSGWHYPNSGVGFPASGCLLNVYAWLAHQRQQKDNFTFQYNRTTSAPHTCRLIDATEEKEKGGLHYRLTVVIEDVNGSPFTEF